MMDVSTPKKCTNHSPLTVLTSSQSNLTATNFPLRTRSSHSKVEMAMPGGESTRQEPCMGKGVSNSAPEFFAANL